MMNEAVDTEFKYSIQIYMIPRVVSLASPGCLKLEYSNKMSHHMARNLHFRYVVLNY